MRTVVVAGAIANKPGNGGEAWVRMSWVGGLAALGFGVRFIEVIDDRFCRDGDGRPCQLRNSVARGWFDAVIARVAMTTSAALLCGDEVHGATPCELLRWADEADLLIDISGHLGSAHDASSLFSRFANTLYVDLDPGYTQVWHMQGQGDTRLDGHSRHATVGLLVGEPDCAVPDAGFEWLHVPPFFVLADWPCAPAPERKALTTVSTWRNPFGPLVVGERQLSGKHHAFRRFADLPARVARPMEVAIDFDAADLADRMTMGDNGWSVVSPREVAGTPDAFRNYVQTSAGEWSVAQGPYVELRTGWVSDRTVRYLASGRPAIVEDTGLGDVVPAGEGLLVFDSVDAAVDAIDDVHDDWERHSAAARELAVSRFSSDVVLPPLLARCAVELP